MVLLIILLCFWEADSFAQTYKYVDKQGRICFTDNLTSSLVKEGISNRKENKSAEVTTSKKRSGGEVKDIMELGRAILEEELAKPREKQNRQLIQEMRKILYGDVPGQISENTRD